MLCSRAALGVLLPVVLSLAACRVERNPEPETLNVDSVARVDIRAAMQAYRGALLEKDARAAAAVFAPDARLLEPGAPDIVGPAGVETARASFFERGGVIADIELEPEQIHVDGRVAFEAGTLTQRVRLEQAEEETVRGRYMVWWRRSEGQWRIERFLINHYPAEPVAEPLAEAAVVRN